MEPVNFLQSPALKLAQGYVCGEAGQERMRFSSPQRYSHDDLPGAMDVQEDLDMAIGRCEQVSEDVVQEDGQHEGDEDVELEDIDDTNLVVYQMEGAHEGLVKSEVIVAEGQQEVVIEGVCEEIVVHTELMDVDCTEYNQDHVDGHREVIKVEVHEEIHVEEDLDDAPNEVYEICEHDVQLIVGEVLECKETQHMDVEGEECEVTEANKRSNKKQLEISIVEVEESVENVDNGEEDLEVIDIEPAFVEVPLEGEDNGDILDALSENRVFIEETVPEVVEHVAGEMVMQEIGRKEEAVDEVIKEIDENQYILADSTEIPLENHEKQREIEDSKVEVDGNQCIQEYLKEKPPESEENDPDIKDNHLGHDGIQEQPQKNNESHSELPKDEVTEEDLVKTAEQVQEDPKESIENQEIGEHVEEDLQIVRSDATRFEDEVPAERSVKLDEKLNEDSGKLGENQEKHQRTEENIEDDLQIIGNDGKLPEEDFLDESMSKTLENPSEIKELNEEDILEVIEKVETAAEAVEEPEEIEAVTSSEEVSLENSDVFVEEIVEVADSPPVLEQEMTASENIPKLDAAKVLRQGGTHHTELEMPLLLPIAKPTQKPKSNCRLTMAQLIEKKLQHKLRHEGKNVELGLGVELDMTNGHSMDAEMQAGHNNAEKSADEEMEEAEETKPKKPIIGCVRKSQRKTGRLTRPPWLVENGEGLDSPECRDNQKDDEPVEEEEEPSDMDYDQEESIMPTFEFDSRANLTNGTDMRAKLTSQLQMLKGKKKSVALFDAKIPDFTATHYEKRSKAPLPLVEKVVASGTAFGFKIAAVASGVDLDDCAEMKMDVGDDKSVIINDHLDLPTIKLTKTKDYKKIKGWSKKKLLTSEPGVSEPIEEMLAGCSYSLDAVKSEQFDVDDGRAGNVFASNSLDGFLQEKDLNISYNVPNLRSTNHNINLLDSCVLVDVEEEKRKEKELEQAELDLLDANSNGSFKDKDKETSVYKPRTLAEKRKMLSDEYDGLEVKRSRGGERGQKHKKFSRRPISSRFESNSPAKTAPEAKNVKVEKQEIKVEIKSEVKSEDINDLTLDDDDNLRADDSLLIPITEAKKPVPNACSNQIYFLTEEASKPKNCVTSILKYKSNVKLQSCSVVTRKTLNRTFYQKHTDIKRKASFELIPKTLACAPDDAKKAPSILTALPVVNYRPGPLCKKQELQVNGSEWETVLINLPKVKVEVRPQIGRKVDPIVRPFIKFETFEVSKSRAEFAISVVKTSAARSVKKDDLKTFQFPTRYQHKQEKLLMRRKSAKGFMRSVKKQKVEKREYKPESEQEVVEACRSVVGGMLDYLDVKALADGLLKYDSDAETKVDSELDVTPPSIDDVLVGDVLPNKRRRDYDKVFWELKRLNVRTVDLHNDEAQNDEGAKPTVCSTHCRLGCVCQSIASRYPPANHCGETRCLFDCVCGFEARCRSESQEDSKSLLNERTLSRFNKEAKRNITAREERDFTQTAVRSKNKTIILGNSRVSKRTPKYNFKRYEGFQFSFIDEGINRTHSEKTFTESYSQKIIRTDRKFKNCAVNVVRCNFDDIVPYCLVHNLYDCHCGGNATYSHFESHKMNQIQKALKNPPKHKDTSAEEKPTPPATAAQPSGKAQREEGGGSGTGVAGQKTDQMVSNPNGLSARMRGTGEFFRARNRTNKYKTIMARKLKYDSTVDSEIVNRWFILPSEVAGLNKPHGALAKSQKDAIASIFDNIRMNNKFVLKEEPDVREVTGPDDSILVVDDDYSILSSRKIKKTARKNLKAIAALLTISGALYSPTDVIAKQFAQMINSKVAPLTEFRLLALGSLMNLYNTREVYVWINSAAKMKFIITDSMSNPKGDTYTNIRKFEKSDPATIKVDFIRWIVTKTLPCDRNNENSLVILRIQDLYWEICGICAKNVHNSNRAAKTKVEIEHQPEEIQKVDEKYYKTVQHVVFANGTFAPKKLVLFDRQDGRKGEMRMEAALPHIVNNCRWRVLKVNSNFAILAFSRNEFRIKCSDILTVMKVSGRYNKTIIINTEEVSANYQHKLFGIYIPPTFQDRIFIGPYQHDEEHGLETLRFVNNELVNTEKFNSMRGISNVATTGLWYQQYGRASGPAEKGKDTDCVIDLTDMEEVRSLMKSSDVTITPAPVSAATPSQSKKSLLKKEPQPPPEPIAPQPVDSKPGTSASLLKPRSKAKQNGAAHSIEINKFPPPQIPELIRIPLKANKKNKNITKATDDTEKVAPVCNFNMDDLMDIATLENIVKLSKGVDTKNLERCFAAKLRILMKQMKVHLPKGAVPFCFRLNFGNGIVLAYLQYRDVVVFWPGDCQKKFVFITVEAATQWLSRELHEVFICVPSTFKIIVTPVGAAHYMEYINRGVISQKYFKEICIIGDFGIMRLSEAQKYLMYDMPSEAKRALGRVEGKSFKFKKAIAQIIDNNDMTKEEFSERVNDLITKAKAAADNPPVDQSRDVPTNCAIPTIVDDVICLDSDDDNDEPPKLQPEATAAVRREAPPVKRATKPRKPSEEEVFKRLKNRPSRRFSADGASGSLTKGKKRQSLRAVGNENDRRRREHDDDVMQIDLTHMTTEKVKALLRANEYGNRITLTSKQVKQLKALSRASGDVADQQNGDAD